MIIFLNGPPGSGKDTIAEEIIKIIRDEKYRTATKFQFKDTLFELLMNFFRIDMTLDEFMSVYYTRETKELPCELLRVGNKIFTPREALIFISEEVIKPSFGKEAFGLTSVKKLKNEINPYGSIFSDCGFLEELIPVANEFKNNCYLVRLSRDGTSFNGDSRNYIEPSDAMLSGIKYAGDFSNNGTVREVANKIIKSIESVSMDKDDLIQRHLIKTRGIMNDQCY